MLAVAGLMIVLAMGFALSGMIADGGPSDGDDAALDGGVGPAPPAAQPITSLAGLLFGQDETDTADDGTPMDPTTDDSGTDDTDNDPPDNGANLAQADSFGITRLAVGGDDGLILGEADPDLAQDQMAHGLPCGGTIQDMLQGRQIMSGLLGENPYDAYTGGPGNDAMTGTHGGDAMFGNEGDDTLIGGDGADELCGDEGDDSIFGGNGQDFLVGGDGNDTIYGGADGDMVFGSDGDDLLYGDAGDDVLQGGFGADTLFGGDGNDTLDGTYSGGLNGFGPFDEDQADQLFGGDGDDMIMIGAGDVATGGEGRDIFITGSYIEIADVAGHVTDFDPTQDVIEVVFDPTLTPAPVISVVDFPDGTGADILFNGQVILTVSGAQGLDPSDIQLREITLSPAA